MAYDDSIYGLTLDQWHRPGQTVVVNPTTHVSDYGVGSMPSSYLPLYTTSQHAKGCVTVAVGSTVVILGGQMGATLFGGAYLGYAKKRLVGLNGGRNWTSYDLDTPWAWPAVCGAWVIDERIYVACSNVNGYGVFLNWHTDCPNDKDVLGLIDMYYSDDLGATWKNLKTGLSCVGADITDPLKNYDLCMQYTPSHTSATYAYGSCIHNGYFVVTQEKGIKLIVTDPEHGSTTYYVQAFQVFTLPTPALGIRGPEGRQFKCVGWFLPSGEAAAPLNTLTLSNYAWPAPIVDFDDHILIGSSFTDKQDADTVWRLYPSHKWKMRFSEDMSDCTFESLASDSLFWRQTTFGVCSYRKQRWVYGGGIANYDSTPKEPGSWSTNMASMTNRMLTSINGEDWHQISYGDSPPAYPTAGFQNVPVRCRHPQMVFIPGTKELLITYSWIGHDYYDDTVGRSSFNRVTMMMAFLHSSAIPFPDEIPDETPWYNYPVGGSASIAPDAPGESGDFTETGDLLRCLRVDLEDGTLTAGSGYPLVSTLQNSSPTALAGQIPDKMLAGDTSGYLNKAMVPEAPGLGNSSRYTIWTLLAGSTDTVLVVDVTSRPNAYLQSHFLTGLSIRIQSSVGVWVESTISDNGNDTITLSGALSFTPAAGTKILIAPMDCAALLNETRYQYPARLVQARINVGNYQYDDQDLLVGIRTAQDRRRFGDFSTTAALIQTIQQRQLEAGGGVVGIAAKASRSLTYDLRFVPNGGGDLEIGPIILTENIAPGEKGLSQ